MLNGYKIIAVCLTKIQDEFTYEFMDALYQTVKGSDYRCLLFNSFSDFYDHDTYDRGAKAIYKLVNFDIADALVIKSNCFYDRQIVEELIAAAKAKAVPVVLINGENEGCFSIIPSCEKALGGLVEHVIREHGKKKLFFLSGKKGEKHSEDRERIFFDTLEKCGIDPETARVGYGEFWYEPAAEVIDRWVREGDLPEAIICANDAMAVSACKRLLKYGIRVPEDMIVTGFDGLSSYQFAEPALSTCTKSPQVLAGKCFTMIRESVEEHVAPYRDYDEYVLTIQESCGCGKVAHPDYRQCADRMNRRLRDMESHEQHVLRWMDRVVETIDMGTIGNKLHSYILPDSLVSINSDFLLDSRRNRKASEEQPFTEDMIVISSKNNDFCSGRYELYKTAEMYPALAAGIAEDVMYIFQSVYAEDMVCGYYVVRTTDLIGMAGKIHRVSKIMNLAFGLIISKMNQEYISKSLNEMQYRDSVTGVWNLKGLVEKMNESYETRRKSAMAVSVYNIPKYQYIYENYGLQDVEDTVRLTVDALQLANVQKTLVARIADDSFVVVNEAESAEKAGEMVSEAVPIFYRFIEGFNKNQDKEYYVEVNCGCTTVSPGWNSEIGTYIKVAFGELYLNRLKQGGGKVLKERKTAKATYRLFDTLMTKNLFYYVFQPIVSGVTGDIYGYEALMRTPEEIGLYPDEILKIAEEYGRLYDVEYATFNNVLEYVSQHRELFEGKRIFINSIPGHFLTPKDKEAIVHKYAELLADCTIEITERDETTAEEVSQILSLNDEGHPCQIAVDDFGTGYSNIVNLLRYKPNLIKIDRYLISEIQNDVNKQMFVKNTIEFAQQNRILCLAEGVETQEELSTVISYGIDLIQGYYTGRPSEQVMQEVDSSIRSAIVRDNKRKNRTGATGLIYEAADGEILDVAKLREEEFAEIHVSMGIVTITGGEAREAGMTIRIADNSHCFVILDNVSLKSDNGAVIQIGEHCYVEIRVRGENVLHKEGIRVPGNSFLHLTGDGSLRVVADRNNGVCIGSGCMDSYGDITVDMEGSLILEASADKIVALGGGTAGADTGIHLRKGKISADVRAVCGVGIGSMHGEMNITMDDVEVSLACAADRCIGIGTQVGHADIISGAMVKASCEGENVVIMGVLEEGTATICMEKGSYDMITHGVHTVCMGSYKGNVDISSKAENIHIYGEGDTVCGIGSIEGGGRVILHDGNVELKFLAGRITYVGGEHTEVNKINVRLKEE